MRGPGSTHDETSGAQGNVNVFLYLKVRNDKNYKEVFFRKLYVIIVIAIIHKISSHIPKIGML